MNEENKIPKSRIIKPFPHDVIIFFFCDLYRRCVRYINPGKTDRELGIDRPFVNEILGYYISDFYRSIIDTFKRFIYFFIQH